jgi:low temperature requirement protein LtrA
LRSVEERERHASWTELFFDLVFVVAVGRTGDLLRADQSVTTVLWFAGVFVLVVWSWAKFVTYTERFDTDDVVHRLAKASAMFAIAACAYAAPGVRGDRADEFAIAFIAVKLVLLALYVRAWRHVPEVRSATIVYIVSSAIAAALWALSLGVSGNARTALWIVAGVEELLAPILGWRRFGSAAFVEGHLQERCGLFTLIVLGEGVVGAVDAVDGASWDGRLWLTVAAGAVIVLSVWWMTFDFVEVEAPSVSRGLAYLYSHLPLYGAIAALGISIELALHHAHEERLPPDVRWLAFGAAITYLLAVTAVRGSADPHAKALLVHPIAAIVVLGIAIVGGRLGAPGVLWCIAVVLVAELVYKFVAFSSVEGTAE